MYINYWINISSGRLYRSGSPKTDRTEGIGGWKKLTKAEWELIMIAFSNSQNVERYATLD